MMGPGMMAGGWLVGLVFLLLVIAAAAAAALVIRDRNRHAARPADSTPRELLANRFARGEIDDEEYYLRLSALDATTPTSPPRRR